MNGRRSVLAQILWSGEVGQAWWRTTMQNGYLGADAHPSQAGMAKRALLAAWIQPYRERQPRMMEIRLRPYLYRQAPWVVLGAKINPRYD
jgi:hypothetical protein